ncbi:SNF2 family N-terminal domain-containing protein [Pyrenochaeta sp. MPI-SDFR-AT-0127]|nr:SNF2 family N-terminal domain-containing protein [Pyrenochaeta sp. MPI-SDFR-AT-0127]
MSSPKKHGAPFRPVNSLSSPQKPTFAQRYPGDNNNNDDDDDDIDNDNDRSPALLGNSSSLFEESELPSPGLNAKLEAEVTSRPKWFPGRHNSPPSSSPPRRRMVREREAPAPQPPRNDASTTAPPPRPRQEQRNPAPQFGQPSPLKNPLKTAGRDEFAHLFNKPRPGQMRPEHQQGPIRLPSQYSGNSHRPPQNAAHALDGLNRPFKGPSQSGPRYSSASSTGSDIFEIPAAHFQPRQPSQGVPLSRPGNVPAQTVYPPPRPIYSSMGQSNGFQPLNKGTHNPLQQARQTVILDDEDDFDPDAAIRAEGDRFGAPDMHAYVDSGQASENIKALLEGAFDEDGEKIPRTCGRKKKTKQRQEDDGGKSLADRLQALAVKDEEAKADAGTEGDEDEEDDGTVDGLKVKLLPHQVDGVAWMIEKETGNHNKRAKLPKGGILADDMGLGKTVQSIALILSNPRPEKGVEPENKKNKISDVTGKGTLVVAPLALIKQWEAEINTKVSKSHELKVLVHHGPNRTKSAEKLKQYDVVITTYQVLASEHASCGDGPDGLKKGCFAIHWYRTMLDEAHTIKNRNAKMTKACYDVRSHYRWCLTGTPMQNNLDELQSLIKFLRIQPYCDMSSWKDSISGPMKNGRGNLAMRRLQIFLKAFMKRRTKDVLKKEGALNFGGKTKEGEEKPAFQIVARNVETVIGEFTAKERAFYDRLSDRAQSRLDEMMGGEKQDYIGALVLLLRLRQACNHPNLTKSNVKDDKDALTTGSKPGVAAGIHTPRKPIKDADADDLADLLGGLSVATKRCDICQSALTRDNADSGAVRCKECETDLNASARTSKKHKQKHKCKAEEEKHCKSHDRGEATKGSWRPRQRRVVVDSDDEDTGEWLIPEHQQHSEDLGKAGGTDDENAEGGGDTIASVDSHSTSSVDESKSNLDSFIVHDTDSEDGAAITRKKHAKKSSRAKSDSETDLDDQSDSSNTESLTDSDEGTESDTSSGVEYNASDLTPSTKIRQLLTILEKETPDHKVIVFSQFTSMLDLIEPFLKRGLYSFTRYDGSMRNDLREASLHKLRNDKRTRVLLCSLKCGSLGLNLTAASRVVIMEPFWNPFVEEQAIDRVHRLNQTIDVTVYRLSIQNSVEERILELQEAKRKLANAALEGGKAIGKLSMKDILALFKREAEYDHKNVDDEPEIGMFGRTRVLEGVEKGETTREKRKAGSLGFRKEDGVYGRR